MFAYTLTASAHIEEVIDEYPKTNPSGTENIEEIPSKQANISAGAPKVNQPNEEPNEEPPRNTFPEEEFIGALIELGKMVREQREEGQVA